MRKGKQLTCTQGVSMCDSVMCEDKAGYYKHGAFILSPRHRVLPRTAPRHDWTEPSSLPQMRDFYCPICISLIPLHVIAFGARHFIKVVIQCYGPRCHSIDGMWPLTVFFHTRLHPCSPHGICIQQDGKQL